jgi:hypothetical protein
MISILETETNLVVQHKKAISDWEWSRNPTLKPSRHYETKNSNLCERKCTCTHLSIDFIKLPILYILCNVMCVS